MDDTLDASLERTAGEFAAFAASAVDPATGEPWATTEQLLYSSLGNELPAENEAIVAFVAGELRYRQANETLQLGDDAEFVAHVAPLTTGERAFISSTTTGRTNYRFAVVPVSRWPTRRQARWCSPSTGARSRRPCSSWCAATP